LYALHEVVTELEIKLVLPTFLGWDTGDDSKALCIAQDLGSKVRIDQDACLALANTARHCGRKAFIDDALGSSNLYGLRWLERTAPAKHAAHERRAVIERQDVQRLV